MTMTIGSRNVLMKSIVSRDGAEMLLIPAGEFLMGSNDGDDDERPVHAVYLDAFYMDVCEVTNALYKKFMDATGHKAPAYWDNKNLNQPNPVVGVTWFDAEAYAKWAGKRLPTEAEWEKAARGGLVGKEYPCGDNLTHDDANYGGTGRKDRWDGTAPVGSFTPNGYGLYDMVGNVWEWCADWYDKGYYARSPRSNPKGPDSGTYRVLRGGSWDDIDDDYLRAAFRSYDGPLYAGNGYGFRCAGDVPYECGVEVFDDLLILREGEVYDRVDFEEKDIADLFMKYFGMKVGGEKPVQVVASDGLVVIRLRGEAEGG